MLAAALAALLSAATTDNGRLLTPFESREEGRCCQESVPDRERGIDALGDDLCDGGLGESPGESTLLTGLAFIEVVARGSTFCGGSGSRI